jgi:quercetin dioxygenase-like cupin family protein
VQHWDLRTLEVRPHLPAILHSTRGEARSIVLTLPAGDLLQEHEVHERAHLVVVDGEVDVLEGGGTGSVRAGAGGFFVFEPHERHEVRAVSDARLLLVLAPWPGDGHPGAREDAAARRAEAGPEPSSA